MFLPSLLGLVAAAAVCLGASLQQVSNFGNNPTRIQMYAYVPDKLAAKPPIIVAVRRSPRGMLSGSQFH
jgi:hypothetical protein